MCKISNTRLVSLCSVLIYSLIYTIPSYADSLTKESEPKDLDESSFFDNVKKDYGEFYSSERLIRAGIVFAGGAVFANTDLDQNIQDHYQDNIRSDKTDEFSKVFKTFGEGKYLITLSLITTLTSRYMETNGERSAVGRWGENTLRAYLVGGPATLLTQQLTGASRPDESTSGSKWKPFSDSNGVSGHAFIGSVPFITIAKMNEDNTFTKYLFYTLSTFTAISRVNDNSHYFSQAVLGWYLGYEASDAVSDVNSQKNLVAFRPYIGADSYGITMNMKW